VNIHARELLDLSQTLATSLLSLVCKLIPEPWTMATEHISHCTFLTRILVS
jgi:hypothetical protein